MHQKNMKRNKLVRVVIAIFMVSLFLISLGYNHTEFGNHNRSASSAAPDFSTNSTMNTHSVTANLFSGNLSKYSDSPAQFTKYFLNSLNASSNGIRSLNYLLGKLQIGDYSNARFIPVSPFNERKSPSPSGLVFVQKGIAASSQNGFYELLLGLNISWAVILAVNNTLEYELVSSLGEASFHVSAGTYSWIAVNLVNYWESGYIYNGTVQYTSSTTVTIDFLETPDGQPLYSVQFLQTGITNPKPYSVIFELERSSSTLELSLSGSFSLAMSSIIVAPGSYTYFALSLYEPYNAFTGTVNVSGNATVSIDLLNSSFWAGRNLYPVTIDISGIPQVNGSALPGSYQYVVVPYDNNSYTSKAMLGEFTDFGLLSLVHRILEPVGKYLIGFRDSFNLNYVYTQNFTVVPGGGTVNINISKSPQGTPLNLVNIYLINYPFAASLSITLTNKSLGINNLYLDVLMQDYYTSGISSISPASFDSLINIHTYALVPAGNYTLNISEPTVMYLSNGNVFSNHISKKLNASASVSETSINLLETPSGLAYGVAVDVSYPMNLSTELRQEFISNLQVPSLRINGAYVSSVSFDEQTPNIFLANGSYNISINYESFVYNYTVAINGFSKVINASIQLTPSGKKMYAVDLNLESYFTSSELSEILLLSSGYVTFTIYGSNLEYPIYSSTPYSSNVLYLPSGTYNYSVHSDASNYWYNGSFSITDKNLNVSLNLMDTPGGHKLYVVSVNMKTPPGLYQDQYISIPPSALLYNSTFKIQFSELNDYVVLVPSGNYTYSATVQEDGIYLNWNYFAGHVMVDNNTTITINPEKPSGGPKQYPVEFLESGLYPIDNYKINVSVNSTIFDATNSIMFLPNGTYAFTVLEAYGMKPTPSSGTINVSGQPEVIPISFQSSQSTIKTYTLSFNENGLPNGTTWTVDLNGTDYSSNTDHIVTYEPDGSYSFRVIPIAGYNAKPSIGWIFIDGLNDSVNITFSKQAIKVVDYSVTFSEKGLPPGTSWSVTLGNQSVSEATPSIVFNVPNGSYNFTVSNVSGYQSSSPKGFVAISGTNASLNVTFTQIASQPPSGPSGFNLASYEYYIIAGVVIAVAAGIGAAFVLRRRKGAS